MAVLEGLELIMHVSQEILLKLIDPLLHKISHHEIIVVKVRFRNVHKIVFGIKDLFDVFRYGDSQLAVFEPFVIIELWLYRHDLFEMVQGELFSGLLSDHSANIVKHEFLVIFVKNIHRAVDESLELD